MEIIYLGTPLRRRKNNTPPPTPPANTKTQQPPAPNGQQNIWSEKVSGFGGRFFNKFIRQKSVKMTEIVESMIRSLIKAGHFPPSLTFSELIPELGPQQYSS